MALKAGYIGIKKSMLGLINSLASAKLIKSFGDGLNLTQAGKLNMTAATASKIGGVKVGEGLSINEGVLSTNSQGLTIDVLYDNENTSIPDAIELVHPYTDYKFIVFGCYETENLTYNDMYGCNVFLSGQLEEVRTGAIAGNKTATVQLLGWQDQGHYCKLTITDTTHFSKVRSNYPPNLGKIYGIK